LCVFFSTGGGNIVNPASEQLVDPDVATDAGGTSSNVSLFDQDHGSLPSALPASDARGGNVSPPLSGVKLMYHEMRLQHPKRVGGSRHEEEKKKKKKKKGRRKRKKEERGEG